MYRHRPHMQKTQASDAKIQKKDEMSAGGGCGRGDGGDGDGFDGGGCEGGGAYFCGEAEGEAEGAAGGG